MLVERLAENHARVSFSIAFSVDCGQEGSGNARDLLLSLRTLILAVLLILVILVGRCHYMFLLCCRLCFDLFPCVVFSLVEFGWH
jgi:hypothetical protein